MNDGKDKVQSSYRNNAINGEWLKEKAGRSTNTVTEGTVHLMGTPIPRHDEPEVVKQQYLLKYLGACQ